MSGEAIGWLIILVPLIAIPLLVGGFAIRRLFREGLWQLGVVVLSGLGLLAVANIVPGIARVVIHPASIAIGAGIVVWLCFRPQKKASPEKLPRHAARVRPNVAHMYKERHDGQNRQDHGPWGKNGGDAASSVPNSSVTTGDLGPWAAGGHQPARPPNSRWSRRR